MADLFQVTRPIPSPAIAMPLEDIDKEKDLGLLINAVFKLKLCAVGVILDGHTSELLVKYGKNCWKLCEPVAG